jgi:hypothetical protein
LVPVFVLGPYTAIFGIAAILLGRASRKRIQRDPMIGRRSLATAAIWMGVAELAPIVLLVVFVARLQAG